VSRSPWEGEEQRYMSFSSSGLCPEIRIGDNGDVVQVRGRSSVLAN
jgi:hypothetical protein